MLNVCGVTFDHTTNYGSCLQAYALQRVIEEMSIAGEKCSYQLIPRALFPSSAPKINSLKTKIKRAIKAKLTAYRRKRFIGFEDRYMHYANCRNREDLPKMNAETDAFVCGSDVIWNLSFTQGDPVYFLDFARKYKFSYAASFGVVDILKDYDAYYGELAAEKLFKKYLPALDQISVREKSAIDTVRAVSGMEAVQVCDPVLLLTLEQWKSIAAEPKRQTPYIFAYSTYISPNYMAFLNKIQAQTGLPLIHVTWDIKASLTTGARIVPTPEEWLRLLMDAEYVVTNSFHGTAFCTLFHKPFFWARKEKTLQRSGVRIADFLQDMELEARAYTYTPDTIDLTPPDFTQADRVIEEQRRKSLAFLQENLEAAYREKQAREQGASVGS